MRAVRDRRDSAVTVSRIRWTSLDGTPCDVATLRNGLARLAARLRSELLEFGTDVDLAKLEKDMIREHGSALKKYARAWRRVEQLRQQLAAMKAGGARPTYYAADNRRQARGDAKDGRGYAWAKHQLDAALKEARPRARRADPLQRAIIASVRSFILGHMHFADRGAPARVDALTAAYLGLQFPTLCHGITADRIRRRPSLTHKKP